MVGAFLGLFGRGFALDVYAQIGLVMLIGLAAKNAILIVEFAKDAFERGQPLVDAALEGARLRLRPILMTSFAFIFGCVPLWIAQGAGAAGAADPGYDRHRGNARGDRHRHLLHTGPLRGRGTSGRREAREDRAAGAGPGPRGSVGVSGPKVLAIALTVLGPTSFTGCAVGPNYKHPSIPVPERFYGPERLAEARSLADLPWWDVFDDAVLKGLVEEALRNGFDARLAAARVEEARARWGIARSQFFPSVGYEGGGQRTRLDQTVNASGAAETKWSANVNFSWELDLWGRIRRLNESARAQFFATEEARRGVLLSLLSDVAIAYFDLRELDRELEIAKRTTTAFQATLDLFNRRLEGGAASALETSRAEASLGEVAAQIPEIERAIVARENQINFLLGRNPQPIARDGPLTPLPPEIPPGLPSTLLERRPDVRQGEQMLVAANANVGVAKANFFPRLSLTGLFGNVEPRTRPSLPKGKTWSFGAGLLGPLFQGGAIKRSYEIAKAQWEQARIQYEATAANAFGEVSTALVDRTKLVETERQRARTVAAYQEAVRLANIRYVSGLSAYFEVLDAQQQLHPAEVSLALTRRDQLVAVANLYRALGGGWQAEVLSTSGPVDRGSPK